ncbi:MAG: hypothetical protein EA428_03475 [Spirochaetaceae bacterium]|nr:MAG: hypothetical protein EA428_03475 [Spirochaetaceae bacterium]
MQYFVQQQYHSKPAFSGFLPGIAGIHGIPLWAFYVNRGQGIAGFGIESKDGCVAEYQSAAKAYHAVREYGFRTFIRTHAAGALALYEPFLASGADVHNELRLGLDELSLIEENDSLGIRTEVRYCTLVGAPLGALARELRFTNIGKQHMSFEFLDGLPFVVPAGVDYKSLTTMLTTAQAWMTVFPEDSFGAMYRVGASMQDTASVEVQGSANFAAGYRRTGPAAPMAALRLIYDRDILFAPQQFMLLPEYFSEHGLEGLPFKRQIPAGKQHCAFFGDSVELSPGASAEFIELYGGGAGEQVIRNFLGWFREETNARSLLAAGDSLTSGITRSCAIKTGNPLFDAYCAQNFLDNVLRGGYPHLESAGDTANGAASGQCAEATATGCGTYIPVFSRKHGDLERDYNWFVIPPEYYSQGWGNYRDVNQNRRSDMFFVPSVGEEIIREFVSLIQTDGYNPLIVQGRSFRLTDRPDAQSLTQTLPRTHALVSAGAFSPGALYAAVLEDIGPDNSSAVSATFGKLLSAASVEYNASHGEGFWIDHWTYNNDLIENYQALFPDRTGALFWGKREYPYYTSGHRVLPRKDKWKVTRDGVRQYESVVEPENSTGSCWMHDSGGELYLASLGEKLLGLAALKYLGRDAFGIGLEMEAGKPGWYDALNGLPGILGSSLPEAWELVRLIRTLRDLALPLAPAGEVELAEEIAGLYSSIGEFVQLPSDTARELHLRWDAMARCREGYRDATVDGFSGRRESIGAENVRALLLEMERDLLSGLERGKKVNGGVLPCYLTVQPKNAQEIETLFLDGDRAKVPDFNLKLLPHFLEGFVRAMPLQADMAAKLELHHTVMNSALYDTKLRMLRVNAPLDELSHEIGRARAFSPGWLENGSIWMHMQYKYLLALLHAGLYQEFLQLGRTMLVPFMNQEIYGRSTCENSSFIVSSLHPDESLHGRGFVARLSGSTAEFISILQVCLWGRRPFCVADGELQLQFDPCIPDGLFDEKRQIQALFLGQTSVTFQHRSKGDVYPGSGVGISGITLRRSSTESPVRIDGALIPAPYAEQIRNGDIHDIRIELGQSGGAR